MMISRYWSNTEFAAKIRKLAGLDPQPHSATWEGWMKYDLICRQKAPVTHAVLEVLDKIQAAFHYVPEKFTNAIYWVHNVLDSSHTLRTSVKIGGYADLTTKIPDALMYAVIDFVEEECFWMNVMGLPNSGFLGRYANQSYLRRKLFPIKVPDYIRGAEGIRWLEFQMDPQHSSDSTRGTYYDPIIAAYKFAKTRYFTFDVWEESGYNDAERAGLLPEPFSKQDNTRHELSKKIHALEAVFDAEVTEHCSNIIKLRKGLWT